MKQRGILLTALLLILTLAMTLTANADQTCYAAKETVNAYQEKDDSSTVLRKFKGGDKILIEKTEDGWIGVLAENPDGDGQTLAWVDKDDTSDTMPQSFCPHSWSDWKVEQEATCNAVKLERRYCSICNSAEEREGGLGDHRWSDWSVTKEATCKEDGQRTRTCSVCGKTETETIAKGSAHKFGKWTTVKEATCTAEGQQKHTCSICGKEETEAIPKTAHKFGQWKETKKATCSKEGEKEAVCTVCGYKEKQAVDKLPHDYETKIIKEATDHSAGVREKVCKVCKHSEGKEEFDPEGTLRVGAASEEVYKMQQLLADQKYLDANGVDGKFGAGTEKALMAFQSDHGLTADGVCWPQTMKKLEHDFGPWETIEKLTRTTAGERKRVCRDCGFEQHEIITPQPTMESGRRGEDVRAIQQMLTALGYDCGNIDGIYGQKLDAAFGAFLKEQDPEAAFEPGKLTAEQIDALVNAWIASFPEDAQMKETTAQDPVNLALTVNQVIDPNADESDDMIAYNWSVTNLGKQESQFFLLLLQYGDEPDFRENNLVMVLDGELLQAQCGNSVKGTIQISKEFGEGNINFTALSITETDAAKWLSNTVTFEVEAEEETEAETELAGAETEAETEAVG